MGTREIFDKDVLRRTPIELINTSRAGVIKGEDNARFARPCSILILGSKDSNDMLKFTGQATVQTKSVQPPARGLT